MKIMHAFELIPERKICIYGTGGFGREVLCCVLDCLPRTLNMKEMVCFMIDDAYFNETKVLGIPVMPRSHFDPDKFDVVVAVGDPPARKQMVERLPADTRFVTIVHPSAIISEWVEIGEGSIITAGSILTCDIKVGRHAHLNLHTTIGHDCVIGDYFTTGPSANISGSCVIGDCVYIGTNVAIKQGLRICNSVVVGMGGNVVKDILEEGVYVGNPVKRI